MTTTVSLTDRAGWTLTRVYSTYTSREVFTDPDGNEWVRVSRESFNPERGDVEVAVKTRGLRPLLLRRRDALAGNLKREDV
jgi:hypothetical protein